MDTCSVINYKQKQEKRILFLYLFNTICQVVLLILRSYLLNDQLYFVTILNFNEVLRESVCINLKNAINRIALCCNNF